MELLSLSDFYHDSGVETTAEITNPTLPDTQTKTAHDRVNGTGISADKATLLTIIGLIVALMLVGKYL